MALESAIFYLPLHSHSLHRHGHTAGAAAATGEFVTFEGYDTLLAAAEVKLVVDYIGCRDNVESGIVQGFQGALVATIAQELARGEAEEVAAAVPLLTGGKIIVAVTAIHRLKVDAQRFQCSNHVRHLRSKGFLSINGDMEGLEVAVHDDWFVDHALVHIKHREHHIQMDE